MNTLKTIQPDALATPIGPYSPAVQAGNLLFCAGQMALDRETSEPLADLDVAEQTRLVLEDLQTVVEAAGSSLALVLRTTVYLANLDDYAAMNSAYRDAFGEHRPARATFEVAGLLGGLAVEIDAVALVPDTSPAR